eukprot:CAMPEP_0175177826 /NCGR_PEP_ID=MMETSP0087-20121206/34606_1 /TAXON_ID=136419 /ORGANISM="Unknown Unknown, Strain D1" /LENGTH=47 /DNA_ID= /DNA_START= /DNA_END= /DNA_ORIENTATION=
MASNAGVSNLSKDPHLLGKLAQAAIKSKAVVSQYERAMLEQQQQQEQ